VRQKKYTLQLIATLTRVLLVYTGIKSRGYLIFSYFSLAKVMSFLQDIPRDFAHSKT